MLETPVLTSHSGQHGHIGLLDHVALRVEGPSSISHNRPCFGHGKAKFLYDANRSWRKVDSGSHFAAPRPAFENGDVVTIAEDAAS